MQKQFEFVCEFFKTAPFKRKFFDEAHLTGIFYDGTFHEKSKIEVEERVANTVGDN